MEVHTDHGLFGPGSVTWRVHADPVFAVAGLRALLLQGLHPRAMAAVAQSGGFFAEPWGRLARTTEYLATITYGTTSEAERAAARVRGIHRRVRGRDPVTGEEFRADDRDLLLWVHCCETESMISTALRGGVELPGAEADGYVREQLVAARLVGLDASTVPADRAGLADFFRDVRPWLALTAPAREGARLLRRPPMPTWVQLLTPARPAWQGLTGLATALMPPWARRLYRLPGLSVTDPVATASLRALRQAALLVPEAFRDGPMLRAAKRRVAA